VGGCVCVCVCGGGGGSPFSSSSSSPPLHATLKSRDLEHLPPRAVGRGRGSEGLQRLPGEELLLPCDAHTHTHAHAHAHTHTHTHTGEYQEQMIGSTPVFSPIWSWPGSCSHTPLDVALRRLHWEKPAGY